MEAEFMKIASGHSHLLCSPVPLQAVGYLFSRQSCSFTSSFLGKQKERKNYPSESRQVILTMSSCVLLPEEGL